MSAVRLKKGKGEYVQRQLHDGKVEQICDCLWNVDFSIRGCLAQVHGSVLREVMEHNGQYAEGQIRKHRQTVGVDHRCEYCYARRHNWGKCTPLFVEKMTLKDFEKYKPRVVRLGKNTEALHPFYLNTFLQFLDLCKEFGTSIIAPTKAFPYGKEAVKGFPYGLDKFLPQYIPEASEFISRLIKTGSVINYSIGNDKFESGAVSQGFTNSWRIEQALAYRGTGVNSNLTIICDVTGSFDQNTERGFAVVQALEAVKKKSIPFSHIIRLLPLRLTSREFALKATGYGWDELLEGTMFDDIPRRYIPKRNGELAPLFFHPDFQELVDEGVGVCGQVGNYENCDKCHRIGGTRIRFPVDELVEVEYSSHFYEDRAKLREKRRRVRQGERKQPTHKQVRFIEE